MIYYRRSQWEMLENIGSFEKYFTYCGNHLPEEFRPWSYSTTDALRGLESFGVGTMIPHPWNDGRVGVGFLVRVAQTALSLVAEEVVRAGASAAFFADTAAGAEAKGLPLERQLAVLMSWLEGEVEKSAIEAVYDRTRRRYVWEDGPPSDDGSFRWLTEVGQCACAAALNEGGDPDDRGYHGWPPGECVGRGLVATLRAVTPAGADVASLYNRLFKPLQEKPRRPSPRAAAKRSSPASPAVTKAAATKAATGKATRAKPAKNQ